MASFNQAIVLYLTMAIAICANPNFVQVEQREFTKNGKPYYYMGTNFWYGMNLAADDFPRLQRELKKLSEMGITNLRIMGSSQGPENEPYRMLPAVEENENFGFNETVLAGLDRLLAEMGKLGMVAVVPLNDFWFWSGGFAQYVCWFCNKGPIPYPQEGHSYPEYIAYTENFYRCPQAIQHYNEYFKLLANRRNTITNTLYKDDPTIMAWQIANEPWPVNMGSHYTEWLTNTTKYIKGIDPDHLLSVGIEGLSSDPDYLVNSQVIGVDYMTCHLWVENWGWYNASDPRTLDFAKRKAHEYINAHLPIIHKVLKPFVLEEFGLARDYASYKVSDKTLFKDEYYELVFKRMYELAVEGLAAGVNFWAWGGYGRPIHPGGTWKKGDPWIGDPPHEPQGWYSVYNNDTTVEVIVKYAKLMNDLPIKPSNAPLIVGGLIGLVTGVMAILIHRLCNRKPDASHPPPSHEQAPVPAPIKSPEEEKSVPLLPSS